LGWIRFKKSHQNLGDVSQSIDFLEEVTGITSHSDGNYFGRFDPTEEDYTNWFKNNYSRLYWDEKEQKVKVKTS
jgi:acyl-homoserine lactone acylase PvdQ